MPRHSCWPGRSSDIRTSEVTPADLLWPPPGTRRGRGHRGVAGCASPGRRHRQDDVHRRSLPSAPGPCSTPASWTRRGRRPTTCGAPGHASSIAPPWPRTSSWPAISGRRTAGSRGRQPTRARRPEDSDDADSDLIVLLNIRRTVRRQLGFPPDELTTSTARVAAGAGRAPPWSGRPPTRPPGRARRRGRPASPGRVPDRRAGIRRDEVDAQPGDDGTGVVLVKIVEDEAVVEQGRRLQEHLASHLEVDLGPRLGHRLGGGRNWSRTVGHGPGLHAGAFHPLPSPPRGLLSTISECQASLPHLR